MMRPFSHPMIQRAAALALAVLASACGTTGHEISPLPGPREAKVRHPKINPDMPVLPKAGSGRGGYYQDDGPGDNPPDNLDDVPDAQVKAEPYARAANRPYVVFGKTYTPIINDEPFSQRGIGSWYGKKFHGQRTSSGEIYDMYKMTAAHPTLPIPSYARITSIDTGKQVVVRINDRGPFHSSRVVDVSFTASLKLGLLGKGSHEVLVERVLPGMANNSGSGSSGETIAAARRNAPTVEDPQLGGFPVDTPQVEVLSSDSGPAAPLASTTTGLATSLAAPAAAAPAPVPQAVPGSFYLQLGAFSRADKAAELRSALQRSGAVLGAAVEVVEGGALHRVFSGPFNTRMLAAEAARALPEALRLKPIVVRR